MAGELISDLRLQADGKAKAACSPNLDGAAKLVFELEALRLELRAGFEQLAREAAEANDLRRQAWRD